MKSLFGYILLLLPLLFACEKEEEESSSLGPFSTIVVPKLDNFSCLVKLVGTLGGISDSEPPSEYGFVYSYDNSNPTLDDRKAVVSDIFENGKVFEVEIAELLLDSEMTVRVYAKLKNEVYYGVTARIFESKIFTFNFANERPVVINCAIDDMLIEFEVKSCYPIGWEYGIIYFDQIGLSSTNFDTIPKGTFGEGSARMIRSRVSEESNGRTSYMFYLKEPDRQRLNTTPNFVLARSLKRPAVEKLRDFPGALRGEAVSFTLNGKGYVCGGYTASRSAYLDDLWEYTPETDSWRKRSSFPGGPRAHMASFTVGGYAYVGTGDTPVGDTEQFFSSFYRYDPINNVWTQIADYPIAGSAGVSFTIDNYGYVGGVLDAEMINKNFFKYEVSEIEWTEVAPFPGEFNGARNSAVAIGSVAYFLPPKGFESAYYAYDTNQNFWTKQDLQILINGNDGLAFAKNGNVYLITGRGVDVIVEVNFEALNADVLCSNNEFARSEAVGFNIDGSFYIATGVDHNHFTYPASDLRASVYKVTIN